MFKVYSIILNDYNFNLDFGFDLPFYGTSEFIISKKDELEEILYFCDDEFILVIEHIDSGIANKITNFDELMHFIRFFDEIDKEYDYNLNVGNIRLTPYITEYPKKVMESKTEYPNKFIKELKEKHKREKEFTEKFNKLLEIAPPEFIYKFKL